MTAATLLAERQQALDAVLLRLRALEQERQGLVMNQLRLEGAIEALQRLVETSEAPDVQADPTEDDRASAATRTPSAAALPWERA